MGIVIGIALVWFIIEMLLWVLIAQFVSGWYVFFWFVIAAVIGIGMMKKTAQTINPMAQQMRSGVIPSAANQPSEATLTKSIARGMAGLLLLLPGILSDIVAFFLLLPAVQTALTTKAKDYALKNQEKMMAMMAKQMGGNAPFGGMGSMGGMNGMGGNPFGTNNPFGGSPFGSGGPFGGRGTTVDGEAKTVKKDIKRLSSANDD